MDWLFPAVLLFIPGIIASGYVTYKSFVIKGIGSNYLSLTSFGILIWLVAYALEVLVPIESVFDTILIQLHIVGIVIAATSFFLFAVRYALGYSFSRNQIALLLVIPCVSIMSVLTNPLHHLFWTTRTEIVEYGLQFSKLTFGPFLTLHSVFSYGLVIMGSGIFIKMVIDDRNAYSKQSFLVVLAIVTPLIASILYTIGHQPFSELDFSPVLLGLTQLFFLLAFYQTDFYSVIPGIESVGWKYVSYNIDAGIAITTTEGDIVRANENFKSYFDAETPKTKNITEYIPDVDVQDGEAPVVSHTDGKVYQTTAEEVCDNQGMIIGYVFTTSDITNERQTRQQVRVLNRFLRHNLRNELSVILLHAERFDIIEPADSSDKGEIETSVQAVRERIDKLIDMSDSVRSIEKSLVSGDTHSRSVESILGPAVQSVNERYENANIYVDIQDELEVSVCESFEIAIEHMLGNVFKHNEESVEAWITVEKTGDESVQISIRDNGSGIPTEAIESFESELYATEEDQLFHGVGIGFGIAYWLTQQSDGEIEFNSTNSRGGGSVVFSLQQ